eukprot:SAG31_NODE_26904_length_434_cov_1.197015_1_plen_21_part_10
MMAVPTLAKHCWVCRRLVGTP